MCLCARVMGHVGVLGCFGVSTLNYVCHGAETKTEGGVWGIRLVSVNAPRCRVERWIVLEVTSVVLPTSIYFFFSTSGIYRRHACDTRRVSDASTWTSTCSQARSSWEQRQTILWNICYTSPMLSQFAGHQRCHDWVTTNYRRNCVVLQMQGPLLYGLPLYPAAVCF